jgi:hypothetical protein
MPTVNCSPLGPKPQIELSSGIPMVGGKLFTYVAGSVNTKTTTYTDSTGTVANTNPLILNSLGQPATEIWIPAGVAVKHVLAPSTDTDPPTSPVWSVDNLRGINDTSVTIDQWVSGPAPTFASINSFTVAGDQTSIFHVGRRVKVADSATTKYGRITVTSYDGVSLTTVTLANDGANLIAPLSAVSYGLLSATNPSVPTLPVTGGTLSASATNRIVGRRSTGAGVLEELTDLQIGNAYYNISAAVAANALTVTFAAGQPIRWPDGTTSYTTAALTVTASSGSTLGTTNGVASRIWVVAMQNSGTPELAIINTWNGTDIYEILPTDSISTTAEGGAGAADSAHVWYSTTSRSNQAIAVVGYVESTQATAGTWITAPSLVQDHGANVPLPGQVIQTRRKSFAGSTTSYGTGTTPCDASIPQSGEGNAITDLDIAITPRSALNLLRAEYLIALANGSATQVVYAVHRDAVLDAVYAESELLAASTTYLRAFSAEFLSGTTSATTTKLRIGGNAASAIRLGVDTTFATVLFGTANKSTVRVQEIMR